jgi:hypothetical protein
MVKALERMDPMEELEVCATRHGRLGASPPRIPRGQREKVNVPTHNRDLREKWRRRESNPRREPTADESEGDPDLANRPTPDKASGSGHKVPEGWDDAPLGSA